MIKFNYWLKTDNNKIVFNYSKVENAGTITEKTVITGTHGEQVIIIGVTNNKYRTLKFTLPDGTVGTRTISSNFFSDCNSNADIQLKLSKLGKAMLKQYNDVNSSPGTF